MRPALMLNGFLFGPDEQDTIGLETRGLQSMLFYFIIGNTPVLLIRKIFGVKSQALLDLSIIIYRNNKFHQCLEKLAPKYKLFLVR